MEFSLLLPMAGVQVMPEVAQSNLHVLPRFKQFSRRLRLSFTGYWLVPAN